MPDELLRIVRKFMPPKSRWVQQKVREYDFKEKWKHEKTLADEERKNFKKKIRYQQLWDSLLSHPDLSPVDLTDYYNSLINKGTDSWINTQELKFEPCPSFTIRSFEINFDISKLYLHTTNPLDKLWVRQQRLQKYLTEWSAYVNSGNTGDFNKAFIEKYGMEMFKNALSIEIISTFSFPKYFH